MLETRQRTFWPCCCAFDWLLLLLAELMELRSPTCCQQPVFCCIQLQARYSLTAGLYLTDQITLRGIRRDSTRGTLAVADIQCASPEAAAAVALQQQ
jgi:hypothetical protein